MFDEYDEAEQYLLTHRLPVVVKADGLAAGKGVAVAQTYEEGIAFLKDVMERRLPGAAGERVVIEECLPGEEASYIVFTDGHKFVPLPSSQDHKRIGDNDAGPNTGGMGAYSPAPVVTPGGRGAGASGDLRAAARGPSFRGGSSSAASCTRGS